MSMPIHNSAIVIIGGWSRKQGPWRWDGVAEADEEIVALALLECGGSVQWVRTKTNALPIGITVNAYDDLYRDVQVNLGVGQCSVRNRTSITDMENAFVFLISEQSTTGNRILFCEVTGSPTLWLGALFICARNIRSARNGLWHLRPGHFTGEPSLTAALNYGRTGVIPAAVLYYRSSLSDYGCPRRLCRTIFEALTPKPLRGLA